MLESGLIVWEQMEGEKIFWTRVGVEQLENKWTNEEDMGMPKSISIRAPKPSPKAI
jgi:hypothetical protein